MKLAVTFAFLGACLALGFVAGAAVLASRRLFDALHSRISRVVAGALVGLAVALPAVGQEAAEERPSRWAAAAWCPIVSGSEEQPPDPPAEGEGVEQGDQAGEVEQDEPGCDAGIGVDLIGRTWPSGRLSLVGVVGTRSVGAGVAWTVKDWFGPARVSVAAGIVAPFSDAGIQLEDHAFALGITLGLGRPAR